MRKNLLRLVYGILSLHCHIFGPISVIRELGPVGTMHKYCVLGRLYEINKCNFR